jgi:hypothetical protein
MGVVGFVMHIKSKRISSITVDVKQLGSVTGFMIRRFGSGQDCSI